MRVQHVMVQRWPSDGQPIWDTHSPRVMSPPPLWMLPCRSTRRHGHMWQLYMTCLAHKSISMPSQVHSPTLTSTPNKTSHDSAQARHSSHSEHAMASVAISMLVMRISHHFMRTAEFFQPERYYRIWMPQQHQRYKQQMYQPLH